MPTIAERMHTENNPRHQYETFLRFQEPIADRGAKPRQLGFLLPDLSRIDLELDENRVHYLPLVKTTTVTPWPYTGQPVETEEEKQARLRGVMGERAKQGDFCAGDLIKLTGLARSSVFKWMKALHSLGKIERVPTRIDGPSHSAIYYRWRE